MIFWDDGTRRQEIYDIWQRNFHDPSAYAGFYFREVYGKNEVLLCKEDCDNEEMEGELLKGMLHLNPYLLRIKGHSIPAKYIVGVATQEEYRRQGVMRELLTKTFRTLRGRGEMLTYLMPADEQYYLPFDFRFGMEQIEQEMQYEPGSVWETGTTEGIGTVLEKEAQTKMSYDFFTEITDKQLEQITELENSEKDRLFAIYTEVSGPYIQRLKKEIESEHGQLLFAFCEGEYQGRLVLEAENDYLVISQVFCAKMENWETFLQQAVRYGVRHYHYNRYQLILDPSWKGRVKPPGLDKEIRWMPAKNVKKIMFRILNLEKLGGFLESKDNISGSIFIEDIHLKEQNGRYRFILLDGKTKIIKEEDTNTIPDGGRIGIGDLTQALFGNQTGKAEDFEGLTKLGKRIIENMVPISENCIMEIV